LVEPFEAFLDKGNLVVRYADEGVSIKSKCSPTFLVSVPEPWVERDQLRFSDFSFREGDLRHALLALTHILHLVADNRDFGAVRFNNIVPGPIEEQAELAGLIAERTSEISDVLESALPNLGKTVARVSVEQDIGHADVIFELEITKSDLKIG